MPTRGRPAALRAVASFEDALIAPPEAVVDTSFVVEALVPRQPGHPAARRFLELMAEAGTTLFINRLLELELSEAVFRLGLSERHGNWRRARRDGRARRRAGQLVRTWLADWETALTPMRRSLIELHEVIDLVPTLMQRYGLSSYDAVHAATAQYAGVRDVVTLDPEFSLVPHLTLHVNSANVRRCRLQRSRL